MFYVFEYERGELVRSHTFNEDYRSGFFAPDVTTSTAFINIEGSLGEGRIWGTLSRARTMWVAINDKDVPEIVKLAFTLTQ